jgi:AcrR family transcriptional regulator
VTTSLRERRRQMLRDEILHAAGALLNERGYAAMSMDDLANRVGISKPTLYSHFTTKEDLIVAAILRAHDRIAEAVQADPSPRTPLQQLSFILHTAVQIQIEEGGTAPRPWAPEVFRVLCTRHEIVERLKINDQAVAELVDAAIAQGEIDPGLEATTVVRAFFSLVNTLNTPFMVGRHTADAAVIADSLAAIFERGVRVSDRA